MENLTRERLGKIFMIVIAVLLLNCKSKKGDDPTPQPDPELTEQEKVTALLTAGIWKPQTVVVSGVDVTTDLFDGFTITFTANQFTTTGTSPIWLRSDTWKFKGESASIFTRGQDSKEVTLGEVTETTLMLSLEWDQTTFGGRTKSLPGKYEFTMIK